jgi:hypothetical protein
VFADAADCVASALPQLEHLALSVTQPQAAYSLLGLPELVDLHLHCPWDNDVAARQFMTHTQLRRLVLEDVGMHSAPEVVLPLGELYRVVSGGLLAPELNTLELLSHKAIASSSLVAALLAAPQLRHLVMSRTVAREQIPPHPLDRVVVVVAHHTFGEME